MQQIGPYTLLDEIARGGHGVVYRAQSARGQVVALKLLLAHRAQSEGARRRFQAEVNALARLRHPHVVPIVGAGEHEGCPWLALEYVAGESLEARLRRGPLPIHEAIRVAQQLAQALSYVHACGVLHRDLKPDNVLLRGTTALLTDFGLALDDQTALSRLTVSGAFLGTPGYWAPEQAHGETRQHGERTDVYGLGAVLYACLVGNAPVQARSLQEHLTALDSTATPPPTRVRPDVPAWLSELCMHCLAKDPLARPGSADEVARALVLAGATTAEQGSRTKRWLAALAAALLVASVGVMGWALSREARVPAPGVTREPPPVEQPTTPEVQPNGAVKALLKSAGAQQKARRYPEAIEDYDKALALDPGLALAYSERGHCKLRLMQVPAAIEDFTTALELNPQDASTFLIRGTARVRLEEHAEAIEDCDAAIKLDPDLTLAFFCRGVAKAELGRHAAAIADFDRVVELDPQLVAAYSNRGESKAELGRHAEAIDDLDTAIELDPRNADSHYARGLSKAKLSRLVPAIRDFDRALELEPQHALAYKSRGASNLRLKRYDNALRDYEAALEIDPGFVEAYYGRGVCHLDLGHSAEAIADFDTTIELGMRDANVYFNRALSEATLTRYAKAVESLDTAIELSPRHPLAYNSRGYNKARLGRHAEAIEDFNTALELEPSNALAYNNRGLSKAELGRHSEAIADLDRAIELDPQRSAGYSNRGLSKAELGRYVEAIEDYDQAIALSPNTGRLHADRGHSLAYLERYAEAVASYDRALQLGLSAANAAQIRQARAAAAARLEGD